MLALAVLGCATGGSSRSGRDAGAPSDARPSMDAAARPDAGSSDGGRRDARTPMDAGTDGEAAVDAALDARMPADARPDAGADGGSSTPATWGTNVRTYDCATPG